MYYHKYHLDTKQKNMLQKILFWKGFTYNVLPHMDPQKYIHGQRSKIWNFHSEGQLFVLFFLRHRRNLRGSIPHKIGNKVRLQCIQLYTDNR